MTPITFIAALPCSLCAVFMTCFAYKGHACQLYRFATTSTAKIINEREKPKACLTNYKGSISHPSMPLVINSLRANAYTRILTSRTKAISKNQSRTSLWPACDWFEIVMCQIYICTL